MGAADLPDGIEIEPEEGKFLMRIPIKAQDARSGLAEARGIAEDYCRVLASTYSPFRVDIEDPRDHITRTDAIFVEDGPVPPADVAEGYLTEAGAEWLDPDGSARRQGKVFRLRASGLASRPIDECNDGFARRTNWPKRLRNALSLYWAAQCIPDRQVRFTLAMAALEVLAQAPMQTLLKARLEKNQRAKLLSEIDGVLKNYLDSADVKRLRDRMEETRAESAIPTLVEYINARIPSKSTDFGGQVSEDEVRTWVRQRGGFLHNGPHDPAAEHSRERLDALVGAMLRSELREVAPSSNT